MQTGKSIPVLKDLVADGAAIDEMGNIIMPVVETTVETVPTTITETISETTPSTIAAEAPATEAAVAEAENAEQTSSPLVWIIVTVVILVGVGIAVVAKRRNKK